MKQFAALALLALTAAQAFGIDYDARNEATMRQTSEEMNKHLPSMVDKDQRLDSTAVVGLRFIYSYTMVNLTSKDVDKVEFTRILNTKVKNGVCTNPDQLPLLRVGTTISYMYRGSDGAYIGVLNVSPQDCGVQRTR